MSETGEVGISRNKSTINILETGEVGISRNKSTINMSETGEVGISRNKSTINMSETGEVKISRDKSSNCKVGELSGERKGNIIELSGLKDGHKVTLRIELPNENDSGEAKNENNSGETKNENDSGETKKCKNCNAQTIEKLEVEAARRQQELLAERLLEIQTENKQIMDDLIKAKEELENKNEEIGRVKEENSRLRKDLKSSRDSLEICQTSQQEVAKQPSPTTKDKSRRKSFGKNMSRLSVKATKNKTAPTSPKYSKKDISEPKTDSFVHVTGVQMKGAELKIIDNSGQVDERLRKFLAIAGLSEEVLKDPSQLAVIEKFAQEEHVLEKMDECKNIPDPPPPPPPPPPPLPLTTTSSLPLVRSTPPRSPGEPNRENDSVDGAQNQDMMSLIRNKTYKLNRVQSQDVRDWKEERKLETNELLSALRGALVRIGDATGQSTDDDLVEEEIKEDW